MIHFDFITHESFRNSLEEDYREMISAFESGAWKSVHVLAGSIIEAVLLDFLISENAVSHDAALKMDFGDALKLCRDRDVISQRTLDLSSVIKSYRNLVHPGRLIRLNESVNHETAEVTKALVGIVANEISRKRQEKFGYTAEQIVSKLQKDSLAKSILRHLLAETNPLEIGRLLDKILPEAYMKDENFVDAPPYIRESFQACFRLAFEMSSDDLKRKITQKFVKIVKEANEDLVLTYGTAFFRTSDLVYLSIDDIDIVKQHLFGRMAEQMDMPIITMIGGLAKFVSKDEVKSYVDPLVRAINGARDVQLAKAVRETLERCSWSLATEIETAMKNRIEFWVKYYRGQEMHGNAMQLEEILGVWVPF